ncbi:MAG: Na+/H+ antiporter NhaA [Gammaproteobacteria bacterium]|nr:Na+/H+ antiporter NhaA [Gammaproteobacteria bacterium]MDH5227591.1 Na+/H+ antiporter NhaA [Gammaproteobacteria bacterium]
MNQTNHDSSPVAALTNFLKLESASGILLVIAGTLAMIAANTQLAGGYQAFLGTPISLQIGSFQLDKPLLIWINDLLMAIFFLLVGLEIKREVVAGELSDPSKVALPGIAAIGGMVVPAAIYASLNLHDPVGIRGWAIPSATDIAFALGVLSLFGSRVPVGLKVFLMTLAVLDDLGAIVIIALFYTSDLSFEALTGAGIAIAALATLNRRGVMRIAPYLLIGTALWVFVLKSGVHATLAGVVTALLVPAKDPAHPQHPPASRLEHSLHPWVAFGILPVFAFANAGVNLSGMTLRSLLDPIPLGILLGLFVGKQIGVFAFSWAAVKSGLARLPTGVTFAQVYGAAILCGIGFTMSLFIGMLAFENAGTGEVVMSDRLGILAGTLLSAVYGSLVLHWVLPRGKATN